ncbi:unnamed protein product [Bursaphelenchus xylophilus]|uniref:(pine wood nematode) hypothetical protein n=1 Tax=Bursaphelenchus xylophilus TaxID=6326 RepID=A0A7I8XLL1_BURXY|nr:unnamed protein product [Bursaphelenchus xylophilus]CAG9086055.1 unnamed protein product [Bursaphelenchus xylophilus]
MDDDSMAEEMDDAPNYPRGFRIANMLPESAYSLQRMSSFSDHESPSINHSDYAEDESVAVLRLRKLYPAVNPDMYPPLPRFWNPMDKYKLLVLSSDYLRIKYSGKNSALKDPASVRANAAIPRLCGIFYYEIRVMNIPSSGCFAIGLGDRSTSLNKLPGVETGTFGYHADKGRLLSGHTKIDANEVYKSDDIIGCGINFVTRTIFFTKNGQKLQSEFTNVNMTRSFYPIVGTQCPADVVDTNFGQKPFVYDIESEIRKCKEETWSTIQNLQLPPLKSVWMSKSISDWLAIKGYTTALTAFNKINGFPQPDDCDLMRERRRIVDLITSGRVAEAIQSSERVAPNIFEKNPELGVLLRIQEFIEALTSNFEKNDASNVDDSNKPTTSTHQPRNKRSAPDGENNQTQPKRRLSTGTAQRTERYHGFSDDNGEMSDGQMNGLGRTNGASFTPTNGNSASTNIIAEMDTQSSSSPEPTEPADSTLLVSEEKMSDGNGIANLDYIIRLGQDIQKQAEVLELPRGLINYMDEVFSVVCYPNPKQSPKAYLFDRKYRYHLAKYLNRALLQEAGDDSICPIERLFKSSHYIHGVAIKKSIPSAVFLNEDRIIEAGRSCQTYNL